MNGQREARDVAQRLIGRGHGPLMNSIGRIVGHQHTIRLDKVRTEFLYQNPKCFQALPRRLTSRTSVHDEAIHLVFHARHLARFRDIQFVFSAFADGISADLP